MHLFDGLATLAIASAMSAAALLAYASYKENRAFTDIVEKAHSIPFNLSCQSDGNLGGRRAGNCFEKGGHRFIREGLGTIIARIQPDGSAEIVYRRNTAEDGGSPRRLEAARTALTSL